MAKLYFRYGTMDSSKTSRLLMDAYEYKQRGEFALIIKPTLDTRTEQGVVKSRVGLQARCSDVSPQHNLYTGVLNMSDKPACIFVDEAQFLTMKQVIELRLIVDNLDIPVMCYGLKSDFCGSLFEGSKALFEHANRVEEIKTICRHEGCKNKAMYNVRYINGKAVFTGDQVAVGDTKEETDSCYYTPKCSRHFFEEFIKQNKGV